MSRRAATAAATSPVARRTSRRPELTIGKLLDAAAAELAESSYANLSVRAVASRADVSAASAYKYFPSKSALVAEMYLRLIRSVPLHTDVNQSAVERVCAQMRDMALLVADDRELTSACTSALMADDPAVVPVRDNIAHEVAHRISSALGPGWPSVVHSTLFMAFSGALVSARAGSLSNREIADQLDAAVALILGSSSSQNPSSRQASVSAQRRAARRVSTRKGT